MYQCTLRFLQVRLSDFYQMQNKCSAQWVQWEIMVGKLTDFEPY